MRERPAPAPVYAIADVTALGETPLPEAVAALARAGVGWIQIRAKALADDLLYEAVEGCFEALEERRGGERPVLWMDDRADLAALFPFAGVHLGQQDLPPEAARRVVGEEVWIGASTHNDAELAAAAADPAVDVVAVGPVFATSSKADPDPVVGLELIERARRTTDKTLVAIGGFDANRLPAALAAGADAVAVLGAVCHGDVEANARRLVTAGEAA